MADSSYPYPPDRFDDEADAVSFHGAHRAEEPFWRQNLLYIAIIGAAFLTLLVLLLVIGGMGGDDRASDPTAPVAPSSTASQKPSDKPSEEPAPEVDKGVEVKVINAGGIKGLAGSWKDTLEGGGWTDVKISSAKNRQEEPVVYYREEADADAAQALAKEVGAGEARQSDEYDSPITFLAVNEPEGQGQDQGGDGQGDGEGDGQG